MQHGDGRPAVWVLGDETSELGMQTMTAAAPPTGSIVEVTAVAEGSHLIGPADYGAPLFGDLANSFDVVVHAARIRCPDDRRRLEALIEHERPAHTIGAPLCIEPASASGSRPESASTPSSASCQHRARTRGPGRIPSGRPRNADRARQGRPARNSYSG